MQIVIDIPEETYQYMQSRFMYQGKDDLHLSVLEKACIAIKNGTVLPKGHGRLGDLDALYTDISNGIKAGNYEEGYEQYGHINNLDDVLEIIKFADPVIEADKEA